MSENGPRDGDSFALHMAGLIVLSTCEYSGLTPTDRLQDDLYKACRLWVDKSNTEWNEYPSMRMALNEAHYGAWAISSPSYTELGEDIELQAALYFRNAVTKGRTILLSVDVPSSIWASITRRSIHGWDMFDEWGVPSRALPYTVNGMLL